MSKFLEKLLKWIRKSSHEETAPVLGDTENKSTNTASGHPSDRSIDSISAADDQIRTTPMPPTQADWPPVSDHPVHGHQDNHPLYSQIDQAQHDSFESAIPRQLPIEIVRHRRAHRFSEPCEEHESTETTEPQQLPEGTVRHRRAHRFSESYEERESTETTEPQQLPEGTVRHRRAHRFSEPCEEHESAETIAPQQLPEEAVSHKGAQRFSEPCEEHESTETTEPRQLPEEAVSHGGAQRFSEPCEEHESTEPTAPQPSPEEAVNHGEVHRSSETRTEHESTESAAPRPLPKQDARHRAVRRPAETHTEYSKSVYIGLDFGTTFTKAAYEVAPNPVQRYSVKFGNQGKSSDYYLPSVLYFNPLSRVLKTTDDSRSYEVIRYFKYCMIGDELRKNKVLNDPSIVTRTPKEQLCCVFYLSHVIALIKAQVQNRVGKDKINSNTRWYINMGIPLEAQKEDWRAALYRKVLNIAVLFEAMFHDPTSISLLNLMLSALSMKTLHLINSTSCQRYTPKFFCINKTRIRRRVSTR